MFQVFSFFYGFPLAILAGVVFLVIVLTRKKKIAFLSNTVRNPFIIAILLLYFLTFPKPYVLKRSIDRQTIRSCSCLGVPVETNSDRYQCSTRLSCLGIPHSCKVATTNCTTQRAGELTIEDYAIDPDTPFTVRDAELLAQQTGLNAQVVNIREIPPYPDAKSRVSITYKVDANMYEEFTNRLAALPLDRGPITKEERVVCDPTGL
jgi:hypothetical protein